EMLETLARDLGLVIQAAPVSGTKSGKSTSVTHKSSTQSETKTQPGQLEVGPDKMLPLSSWRLRVPRIGLYQSWTANMDEGWTRWVLEQYEFSYTTLHNADIKVGKLREKFDAIILPDQQPRDILEG